MWKRAPILGPILVALVVAAIISRFVAEKPTRISDGPRVKVSEEEQCYDWFDTLGFPDLGQCHFVRVATGRTYVNNTNSPKNTYSYCFLLDHDGQQFRVFTLDLQTLTYRRSGVDKPEHERIEYEEADLKTLAREYLVYLERPAEGLELASRQFGAALGERADCVNLSRACAAHGLADEARRFWNHAHKVHARKQADNRETKQPLQQRVSDEIARAMLWRAVLAIGDPSIPRRDLLPAFEAILQKYPSDHHSPMTEEQKLGWEYGWHAHAAQYYATIVRQMIAEDMEHDGRVVKEPGIRNRVAELIWRLRDQNGTQITDPGSCNIFRAYDRNGNPAKDTPAHQLVEIGYEAVPQLIAALENERLTRSIGRQRSFYFSHHVLRVGDCALAILEAISGRSFWQGKSTTSAMVKDGDALATKSIVEAWWAEIQRAATKQ